MGKLGLFRLLRHPAPVDQGLDSRPLIVGLAMDILKPAVALHQCMLYAQAHKQVQYIRKG